MFRETIVGFSSETMQSGKQKKDIFKAPEEKQQFCIQLNYPSKMKAK